MKTAAEMVYSGESFAISDEEFARFKRLIYELAGISLSAKKKVMVVGRLGKRLRYYGFTRFGQYYRMVTDRNHAEEQQIMVDLLTTNETYFFREPDHFDFLRDEIIQPRRNEPLRIWSAASSSGEEIYTIAMVLAESAINQNWEVLGSDISQSMLRVAERGLYSVQRTEGIEAKYLKKYCLKGIRSQAGTLMMNDSLKSRVHFRQINLKERLPHVGRFDVVFLRNVMIYFDQPTKKGVVERIAGVLKPGGYLFISHSESLHGITDTVKMVRPSIFKRQ